MRFIIGFIFFGLLFYAIHLFFPETFDVLVSWAAKIFNFFQDLWDRAFGSSSSTPSISSTPNAAFTSEGLL